MKYYGTLDDLVSKIRGYGFTVKDVKDQQHGHQIRTQDGVIVNWYTSTNKIMLQGKDGEAKSLLQQKFSEISDTNVSGTDSASIDGEVIAPVSLASSSDTHKKVFLVHGHDSIAREQLELILHKLELNPFVLANTGGGGLTIIEALEQEIGISENTKPRFGIVLMTPDDMGYSNADGEDKIKPRARQNVVLEMGMLISAIGRKNVAILKKGGVEVPSDASGILYLEFKVHVREVVPRLVDRLKASGFDLKAECVSNACK